MKNASICAKKLAALLKKVSNLSSSPEKSPALAATLAAAGSNAAAPSASSAESQAAHDPIAVLVMSMLLWESTTDKAVAAFARLTEHVVDFNDLRVCMPHETLDLIGPRYPRALDRCQRLRAVLRNIYLREHAVNLDRLITTNKREVKKYVETLEGILPYAASRVLLLAFDTHAVPVDDQLRIQLIEAEVSDVSVEVPELSNWVSAQIKPGDALTAHLALQAWIDDMVIKPPGTEKKTAPKRAGGTRKPTAGKR